MHFATDRGCEVRESGNFYMVDAPVDKDRGVCHGVLPQIVRAKCKQRQSFHSSWRSGIPVSGLGVAGRWMRQHRWMWRRRPWPSKPPPPPVTEPRYRLKIGVSRLSGLDPPAVSRPLQTL